MDFTSLSFFFKELNSWLSGHLLVNAARSSFSKFMDKLCLLMEATVAENRRSVAYIEKDSLVQRLARGLHKINAQALKAGINDSIPITVCINTISIQ